MFLSIYLLELNNNDFTISIRRIFLILVINMKNYFSIWEILYKLMC